MPPFAKSEGVVNVSSVLSCHQSVSAAYFGSFEGTICAAPSFCNTLDFSFVVRFFFTKKTGFHLAELDSRTFVSSLVIFLQKLKDQLSSRVMVFPRLRKNCNSFSDCALFYLLHKSTRPDWFPWGPDCHGSERNESLA